MRWVGHVGRTGERRVDTGLRCGDMTARDNFEHLNVYERIILKWIF